MREIKIAAVQMTLKEGDLAGNLKRARVHLGRAARGGADLVVLPEMWQTGFSYRRLSAFAEKTPRTLEELGKWAGREGVALVGSWPEKEGDRLYNTAYVIDRDGTVRGSYRKVHLFRPMREDLFLAPGESLAVVDLQLGKVGVALCYDLRFPELVRKLALAGAEVIAVPSQWPAVRIAHFEALLVARAVENQLFTVGANRTGRGGKIHFGGGSAVVGPTGEFRARGGREEGLLAAEIDLDEIAEVRREICYLDDRVCEIDEFLLR